MLIDALAPFFLALAFLWFAWSMASGVFPSTTRAIEHLGRGLLQFGLVRPTRERGLLFGLWHAALVIAAGATLGIALVPSRQGAELVALLWIVVLASGLLVRPSQRWRRREFPLPRRRRSLPARRRG